MEKVDSRKRWCQEEEFKKVSTMRLQFECLLQVNTVGLSSFTCQAIQRPAFIKTLANLKGCKKLKIYCDQKEKQW